MVIADVKARGGLACKVLPFNLVGVPDLMLAFKGTGIFLVEMKKHDGNLSKIQEARIAWLRDLGIRVETVHSIAEWVELRKVLLTD